MSRLPLDGWGRGCHEPRVPRVLPIAILAVALGLRLYATSGQGVHDWDEAYHALAAKHLAQHPLTPTLYDDAALPYDDASWTKAHLFLNKPPMALWAMAASMRVLGPTVFAMRLPSALLDLIAVWLTYLIGRRLFDERVALGAMALHALLGNALLLVGGVHATDHVDLQLAFWVELAIYGVLRRWIWLVGAATGFALLTKSAPGALPLVLFLLAGDRPWKENARGAAIAACIALAIAAPWSIYLRARWPGPTADTAHAQLSHLWVVWEGHDGAPWFHLEKLGQMHGVLALIPVGWFLVVAFRERDPGARLVALWWAIPLVLFTLSATKMPGYMGIAAAAVCLMTAAFVRAAAMQKRLWLRVLAGAVVVAALVADGRELRRLGGTEADDAFAAAMRALPPKTVVLGVRPAIQAMFFGAHAAYPDRWSEQQRLDVARRGYSVVDCRELVLPPGYCVE